MQTELILYIDYTNQVWFNYLLEINIWVKHSNPYGNQHSRYDMFIANTKRKALWSLLNDIRLTTSDWIAWWVYANIYKWIIILINFLLWARIYVLRKLVFMNNKYIFIPDEASHTWLLRLIQWIVLEWRIQMSKSSIYTAYSS